MKVLNRRPRVQRTYTAEVYRLSYPHRWTTPRLRVRAGTFEQNRDSLASGLLYAWEIHADTLEEAKRLARSREQLAAGVAGRMRRRTGHAATPHTHTHARRR